MGTDKRIRCDAELHRQGVGSLEADAVDVQRQAVRIFRDLDDGVKWGADPLDHPGTEILLDTFEGAGGHDFELIGFELEAVRAVVVPDADALDILTGGDGGSRADNSNQLPLTLDLDPQDAEAGLFAMKGDPLYGTGEAFDRGISRVRLYHGERLLSEGIIFRSIFCISLRSRRDMNRYGQSLRFDMIRANLMLFLRPEVSAQLVKHWRAQEF